jgi:signal transduction histidine kinase/CheY-like chemotaxis protein
VSTPENKPPLESISGDRCFMDVFHFALSACFAAHIVLLLEEETGPRPRGVGLLSLFLCLVALVFLGMSVLAIHTSFVSPLPGTLIAVTLLAAGLGLGAWTFLRPGPGASRDPGLLALAALATGASRWVPLAVFAALLLFGGHFVGLFVRHRARVFSREVRVRWLFPLVGALAIFILTALAAVSEQREKDAEMREDLLLQTRLVANALSPDDLDQLGFTLADETNPVYRRICRQMASFGRLMGHRSIYSQVLRDGEILFGPESLDPKDPMSSRPGTVYEHPPLLNHLLFLTAQPTTVGPYRDEYGTFVSAFVPVLDPATRRIRVVIGMDIETPTWRKVVGWARLRPLLFGFLGLVVIFLAQRALSRSARRPGGAFWVRHAHAFHLFLLGVLVTVYLSQEAHSDEARSRHLTFWQLALSQYTGIQEAFHGIEHKDLQSLVRFFESSEAVTPGEFRNFTADMHRLPYVRAWSFAPRVPPAALDGHLRQARSAGNPHYTVYRMPGAPPGDLYPQMFIEPLQPNVVMLGMDLASEPAIAEAIRHAEWTRRSAISDAFQMLHENGSVLGAAIVHPVSLSPLPASASASAPVADRAPDGLVVAMVRFDLLLRGILDWARPVGPERLQTFTVDLFQLDAGQAPVFLSTTRLGGDDPGSGHLNGPDPGGAQVPLFLLGKTYLLTFTPSRLFSEIFPQRAGRVMLLLGLVLTLVLTLLVGFILSWQRRLRSELDLQSRGWRRSEKKFHTLVEKAPEAVVVLLDGVIQYANAAAQRLLERADGRPVQGADFCGLLHEASRGRVCEMLEGPESASATLEVVLEGVHGQIPCELSCVRIVVEEMRGYLLFIRNLTAQIQAQVENERLQEQLAQARKMETISRLAGGVAHDFNNMLGVILGSADILMDHLDAQDPNRRDILEIQLAASRASDLMRRLLAFARRQDTSPVLMDLNLKLKGLLGSLARQAGEGVTLRWEPAETLWLVSLDPAQLDQMLTILLSNAVDALAGSGTVTLRTFNTVRSRPDTGQTHEYVVLAMADTGVGMEAEVFAHLFEPFYSTKPPGEHSGLGLAMLHGIMSQNGGFIEVRSRPGEGATFELHFPKAFTTGRAPRPQEPAAPRRGAQPPAAAAEPGPETILFVEDEEANLRIGQRILERAGYNVLPASGSRQALSSLGRTERPIHTVICDVALEEVSARELVVAVRERFPAVRVLFVSGYPEEMVVERGWIEAGSRFLPKPFTGAQLLEAVGSLQGQGPHRDDVIDPK